MSKANNISGVVLILLFSMLVFASVARAAEYDLILKNGHVLDIASSVNAVMDVAVKDGKIARVAKNIDSGLSERTIDVSGNYVSPGFIDLHVHVFTGFEGAATSVTADHTSFQGGVTTVVDAGTSGADNFEEFKKIIDSSRVRILAFLNISRTGMDEGENEPPNFDVKLAAATAKKYDDTIVGFKTAHYWRLWKGDHAEPRPYDDVHTPWASVDSLVQAGELADKPVMIDFDAFPPQGKWPERSYRELILEKLRPGDIHTHCYARHFTVIGEDGTVVPDILKARKRGVLFDVGHGGASMLFRNAIPAIEQGYLPDTISTDLHGGNINGPVMNMGFVMSKFLNMGMTLEEVISRVTVRPAEIIKRPDLGTLSVGAPADIAIFKIIEDEMSFVDSNGSRLNGDHYLRNVMTLRAGRIVFDPYGLTYRVWDEIPKDDFYWKNPSGQTW